MLACTKRLVGTFSAFTDSSEPIVNFFAVLVRVDFEGLSGNSLGIAPTVRVPILRLFPYRRVCLADCRAGQYEVPLADDICLVFRRGGKGWGDNDVVSDFAHDAVEGGGEDEGFRG